MLRNGTGQGAEDGLANLIAGKEQSWAFTAVLGGPGLRLRKSGEALAMAATQ